MTMKTFARIQGGIVAELLVTERNVSTMFHPSLVWIDASATSGVAEGWRFDGTEFTAPPAPPPVASMPTIPELQAQITALHAQMAALSKTN